jgi:hypothetical protein
VISVPSRGEPDPLDLLSPADRMMLAVLCLPSQRRRVLGQIASLFAVLHRPVLICDLSDGRRRRGRLHVVVIDLWCLGLLVRVPRVGRAGRRPHPGYCPAEGLDRVLSGFPDLPEKRGGAVPDLRYGAAVLAAARELVEDGIRPGCCRLAEESGVSFHCANKWAHRLKAAGLWPDTVGTRGIQGIARAKDGVKKAKMAEQPAEPKQLKDFVPRVYSTRNAVITGRASR